MSKNILLLEPSYKNKYPPLGLMKLAKYHWTDNVVFVKDENDPRLESKVWDRIYITTLFSFEWKRTEKCIDRALEIADGDANKIFVGGISASLMTEQFEAEAKWKGIRFIDGILKAKPEEALKLTENDFTTESDGTPIDELTPDYSILKQIDYEYPTNDAYFGYTSRGCVRKCAFCGVPKLEGEQRNMPPISNLIKSVAEIYGEKKDLILMDNNITAADQFKKIIKEIRNSGFHAGAKLERDGKKLKRRVDFNQGVDARFLSKNPELMKELATICIDPLRIAFDHWGLRKHYETSIRQAADNGIKSLSNYMLYNFMDTPSDLFNRLVLNIELNQELGIRIWSFPMRYQPLKMKDRSHVGKHWNRYYLRSFQVMLQATHGMVSGSPDFFNMAFGGTMDNYMMLLNTPHAFIEQRNHYFREDGRSTLDSFYASYNRLSETQREELLGILAGDETQTGLRPSRYKNYIHDTAIDPQIRETLQFYIPPAQIDKRAERDLFSDESLVMPKDVKVEDAGLYDV